MSFILMFNVLKFFSKKLIVLLIFESIMLCLIFVYSTFFSMSFFSSIIMLIFSLFMVLDSVLGISILISVSRCSFMTNSMFKSI